MRALITGGSGFVGRYLHGLLTENGQEVSVTKLPHETHANAIDMDVLDMLSIEQALSLSNPDVIYHLAAQSSVALSWKDPAMTLRVNCEGTVNLLGTVKKMKPGCKVILIGSGEEYGSVKDIPVGEDTVPAPGNPYAVSKAAQTMMGVVYAKAYGMDVLMTRSFNHIGAGQGPGFVAPDFCKQIADIEKGLSPPVISVGNLEAKRDFSDVRDIVRAYYILSKSGKSGEIYNIGSGNAVSIQSLLDTLLSLSETEIEVRRDESRMRPSDTPVVEADIGKLTAHTGWKPEIELKESLEDVLNYWRGL